MAQLRADGRTQDSMAAAYHLHWPAMPPLHLLLRCYYSRMFGSTASQHLWQMSTPAVPHAALACVRLWPGSTATPLHFVFCFQLMN